MIGALMLDIAGTELTTEDAFLLAAPHVGGVILFGRNVQNAAQVRDLTQSIRDTNPNLLIAVDQEGGRVQRLREGFTQLPAMGLFGKLYETNQPRALVEAENCGWLMATEVLAVGIDFSFAPVLDINAISDVIGDRGFHISANAVIELSRAFMNGMHRAGMATTGKHFPGHGSVKADSHVAAAVDERTLEDIRNNDMQVFLNVKDQLDALMPAHVIYPKADINPAGFSKFWLQDIIRGEMGFDGVLFSDDLTMQAACVAGGAGERILASLKAGCDMGLVCNNRAAALEALAAIEYLPMPNQARLERMRGKINPFNGETLDLGETWEQSRAMVDAFIKEYTL